MAPAIVLLWAWWRRRGGDASRRERGAALVILLSYVVQFAGLAFGVAAAWHFADPLAHIADFAGLVVVIVVAEYIGHAAAAVLGVNALRRRKEMPCR